MRSLSRRTTVTAALRAALVLGGGAAGLPARLALAAIGPRQLSLAWYVPTSGDVEGRPAVGPDGGVYAASVDGTIYGLSADGGRRWSISAGAATTGSVALAPEGRLVVGDGRGRLRSIITADGTIAWTVEGFGSISSAPVVNSDGRIFFGTDAGELVSLEPDGRERFRLRAEAGITGIPAIGPEGDLIYGSLDGKLRRANAAGEGNWT